MSLISTRIRGNDPSLPAVLPSSASALTRRRAIFGAVALGSASAVAAPALAAPSPDAELFALLTRWQDIQDGRSATEAAYDAASARAKAAYPPRPSALCFHGTDHCHDLGASASETERAPGGHIRLAYRHGDVEALRAAASVTTWAVADDGEAARRVPDPKGEARRQEIIAAHDGWMAARDAVDEATGLAAMTDAMEDEIQALNAAEDAVKLCPARTLAGLVRKAAWVADLLARDAADDELAEVFARQVAAFGLSA